MKKIKQMHAEGFYAVQINASANSAIAEKVHHAKKFMELIHVRLEGFARVYDYLISNDSIFLILQIETKDSIHRKYENLRNCSEKANRKLDCNHVWKMISEQFRHLISMYVKWFNNETGRTGSMVARNYERFYFENETEAEKYISKMKNESHSKGQKLRKYRPSKRVNSLCKKMKKGMIYLCSKNVDSERIEEILGKGSIKLAAFSTIVLRKLIEFTLIQKPSQKHHQTE